MTIVNTTGNTPAFGADEMVSHPIHYNAHPSGIECIEIKRHMTSDAGDAFKYVFRGDLKNGKQDVSKALWYLTDAVKHDDPVWIPGHRDVGIAILEQVIESEPDPVKNRFYRALQVPNSVWAKELVEEMLA